MSINHWSIRLSRGRKTSCERFNRQSLSKVIMLKSLCALSASFKHISLVHAKSAKISFAKNVLVSCKLSKSRIALHAKRNWKQESLLDLREVCSMTKLLMVVPDLIAKSSNRQVLIKLYWIIFWRNVSSLWLHAPSIIAKKNSQSKTGNNISWVNAREKISNAKNVNLSIKWKILMNTSAVTTCFIYW
jgi:hypothetical protein